MSADTHSLKHVILSFPSLLNLADIKGDPAAKRSWVQLAKTGSFVSNRYGKFAITKDDLTQMYRNFNEVTPKAPTELPIDYDHLSMDPKKPGDGIAAGWLKGLELREDGDELWGEVQWTPDGATRIANQEYRFVSPSFVKDHTHKDGKKIGTTLLAAAITNHPFLEGMRALTLYNFSAHGDLALMGGTAYDLAEVGQRVMIAPGNARTQDEIGGTYEIAEVVGEGDDAFVSVKDAAGMVHKWFRMTEVLPASTVPANPAHPALQPGQTPVIPSALPTVPTQPTSQSTNPAAAAAAEAAQATIDPATGQPIAAAPGAAPGAPGAVPPGAAKPGGAAAAKPGAAAAAIDPKTGQPVAAAAAKPGAAKPGAAAAAIDPVTGQPVAEAETPTVENEGATGGEAPPEDEEEEDPEMSEALKKAIAALLASGQPIPPQLQQKGIAHMMFKLRNDKNEEIQVSTEQLAAAGIQVVPEGSTAIPKSELSEMKGTITNLSSTVEVLKTENKTRADEARVLELRSALGAKLKGGFMSKVQHDMLFAQFKDSTDLSAAKAIISTFTTPIIALNKEHGSGGDAADETVRGEQSQEKIIALAATLQKEHGISLSDAVKRAGAQLANDAEAYREHFSNAVQ